MGPFGVSGPVADVANTLLVRKVLGMTVGEIIEKLHPKLVDYVKTATSVRLEMACTGDDGLPRAMPFIRYAMK